MLLDPYVDFVAELISAWHKGVRYVRLALATAVIFVISAILLHLLQQLSIVPQAIAEPIQATLGVLAGLLGLAVLAYAKSVRRSAVAGKIRQAEVKAEEHPDQPQAAWELAQIKLETYLDRNLSQVRSVYWLTVIVMCLGFVLIGYGVLKAFSDPVNLKASVVAAASGILINFIGASFLVVHRSTMSQAKDYVTILERINAVGMAVQIIETLKDDQENLRQRTMASLASEMLRMYSVSRGVQKK